MENEKKKLKQGDVITVLARRWFERVNGNTYHSCCVYVNGDLIGENRFEYGYEDHYKQTAKALLEKIYDTGLETYEPLWKVKNQGIKIIESVTDVQRKKDL